MPTCAEEPEHICNQDAMLVFDASGSMSGDGWGYGSESANTVRPTPGAPGLRGSVLHEEI